MQTERIRKYQADRQEAAAGLVKRVAVDHPILANVLDSETVLAVLDIVGSRIQSMIHAAATPRSGVEDYPHATLTVGAEGPLVQVERVESAEVETFGVEAVGFDAVRFGQMGYMAGMLVWVLVAPHVAEESNWTAALTVEDVGGEIEFRIDWE